MTYSRHSRLSGSDGAKIYKKMKNITTNPQQICLLVRFLKPEYVEPFLDGTIRMMPISSYKRNDELNAAQNDENEAAQLLDPRHFRVRYGDIEIKNAISFKIAMNQHSECHIYCLYAVYFQVEDLQQLATNENFELEYDSEEIKNGFSSCKAVVITNPKQFLKRVADALKQQKILYGKSKLVEYYPQTGKNDISLNWDKVVFGKTNDYSWQSEYRIAVFGANDEDKDKPLFINIGSIRDITQTLTLDDFLSKPVKIKLNLKSFE